MKLGGKRPAGRCVIAVFVCVLQAACDAAPPEAEPVSALLRRAEGTFYQIFSWSFYDSNGDGIGDLKGIAQKLDYLNDSYTHQKRGITCNEDCNESLHVQGIWLTPIMPSPSYHKYDTKDYKNIDPLFGTLKDFQNLLHECHKRDMKLIIDFVMNHSSYDHPWFQKALEEVRAGKPGRYASYYHFYYGGTPPENYHFKVPWDNNASYYKWWGKAADNAWFEGSFWTGMPDLNWDSQALREEFEDIVEFWLSAGLDGFRLDATSWPYKYLGMERLQEGQHEMDKNIELWTWFNNTCRKYNPDVYLVGECWEPKNDIAEYYRSGMNYFGFQFSLGGERTLYNAVLNAAGAAYAGELVWWDRAIKTRNPGAISAPFLSNHDQPRSSTVLADDLNRKMAANLLILAPGTPFMYYGEEIGMTSPPYEVEKPDSDRRGPMCWSWPPVGGMPDPPPEWEWPELAPKSGKGVAQQLNDPASLLRHYIRVGNLKTRYPWLAYGKIESAAGIWNGGENGAESNSLCAYRLTNPDNPSQHLIIAHNTNYMDNQKITVKFDDYLDGIRAGGAEAAGIKYADAVTVWWPTGDGWTDGAWKGRFGGTGAEWTLGGYSTVIFADYVPAWAAE